jgi:hypothetical protein
MDLLGYGQCGGHGTGEAWETFTKDLEEKYKVKIIRQCPRSPETNLLDLGIWMSIQTAVEKTMYTKRGDIQALANAVNDAWDFDFRKNTFKNVYERLQNCGKHVRKLEMPDAPDESDNED